MNTESFAIAVGQIIVLSGFFFWLSKRNTEKIEQIQIDLAVIKAAMGERKCSSHHDRIFAVEKEVHDIKSKINAFA